MLLLALVIDDTIVHWVAALSGTTISAAGAAMWYWGKAIAAWLKPQVEKAFVSHCQLAETANEQIPILNETLKKLGDTQEKQCETLEMHGKLLEGHTEELKVLITEVRENRCPGRDH